jgi:glycosyltransferase involved in cell wall biosynthesis
MDSRLLSHYSLDPDAEILVVTSNWPHVDEPLHDDRDRHGIFVARQIETLRARGYRFDVAFIRGFASSAAYVRAAAFLVRPSARRRYRLVHAHGGEAGLVSALHWSGPLLISYCGDDLLGTPSADGHVPLQGRARRTVIRQGARFARRTITKSREMERSLTPRLRERNSVIPNGVDPNLFVPMDRADARRALAWPDGGRVVMFAADPRVARKRYALAQAACEKARQVLPDIRLHVANEAPPALMPTLMNAADCLVVTSSVEGSPNVVKEALMCNLPIVATSVGDIPELLDGVTPSYVVDANARDIASALLRCMDPIYRSNGRARATHLRADSIADRIAQLYAEILGEISARRLSSAGRAVAPRGF